MTPNGATESAVPRNHVPVPNGQNGWRRPTPGLLQAERFAEAGEGMAVPKSRAIVAVKKVAAAIGLKAQDLLLLDTFGAVTQAQDWEAGRRPIVWASNHFLMAQTGFSLATLRRHVRRLCEAGVISMKDSPNGKRWGRRDAEGVIVEAYGFDLSPLAARAEAFEALYADLQAERAECARLRNAITVTRRMIRAKIGRAVETGLRGPWQRLQETFSALLEGLPGRSERAGGLERFLKRIKVLLASVEQAFEAAFDASAAVEKIGKDLETSEQVTPRSLRNDTHIRTTNDLDPVNSNRFETKHAAGDTPRSPQPDPAERAGEADLNRAHWNKPPKRSKSARSEVDISTLMAACPEFADMARGAEGYLRTWNDVHRAAASLRPHIGISEDAWTEANTALGPECAAASVALILDKTAKAEIKSPGGYLRGMIQKAQTGELHLDRSLYGRLAAAE